MSHHSACMLSITTHSVGGLEGPATLLLESVPMLSTQVHAARQDMSAREFPPICLANLFQLKLATEPSTPAVALHCMLPALQQSILLHSYSWSKLL